MAMCNSYHVQPGQSTPQAVAGVLCLDGYIPAGKYIIDTRPETPLSQVYRALLMKMGDPNHPRCAAFKREHHANRAFMQLAVQMDKAVAEAQREQE